jgi:hypothetical protein
MPERCIIGRAITISILPARAQPTSPLRVGATTPITIHPGLAALNTIVILGALRAKKAKPGISKRRQRWSLAPLHRLSKAPQAPAVEREASIKL